MRHKFLGLSLLVSAIILSAAPAAQAATIMLNDLTAFNTAAGSPGIAINFDAIAAGTDITNSTIADVTFQEVGASADLLVVAGASTFTPAGFTGVIDASTNKLFPTSGLNVLSPGGTSLSPGPAPEQIDDMQLVFSSPVSAVGFDVLFQSNDFASFTTVQAFNAASVLLFSGTVPGRAGAPAGSPGGSTFVGLVSTAVDISRVRILEGDDNAANPDSNIGLDTIRFQQQPTAVPEPSSMLLLGTGGLGLLARLRRKKHLRG